MLVMLLMICAPMLAQVQRMLIHGTVHSGSDEPLDRATLRFIKTGISCSSSASGRFSILRPMGTDTLLIVCNGYRPLKIHVNRHTPPVLKIVLNKHFFKPGEERFALPAPIK